MKIAKNKVPRYKCTSRVSRKTCALPRSNFIQGKNFIIQYILANFLKVKQNKNTGKYICKDMDRIMHACILNHQLIHLNHNIFPLLRHPILVPEQIPGNLII